MKNFIAISMDNNAQSQVIYSPIENRPEHGHRKDLAFATITLIPNNFNLK